MTLLDNYVTITLLASIMICCLILTPLSLYWAYQFWKLYDEHIPFFAKRHPKLVLAIIIIFNVDITIFQSVAHLLGPWILNIISENHILIDTILHLKAVYILLTFLRLWLLYYDYSYSLQSLSLKWQEEILKENRKTPWTHKFKWAGNVAKLSILSVSIGIVYIINITVCEVLFEKQKTVLFLKMSEALSILFMVCLIAFKIRKCRDEFMIQKEFKIYGITLMLLLIILIIIQTTTSHDSGIQLILTTIFNILGLYTFTFISTYWAIKQYQHDLTRRKMIEIAQNSLSAHEKIESRLSLQDILSTKDGFELFANHLVTEFSIENLFFLFEMVQIKKQLVSNKLIDDDKIGVMITIDLDSIDNLKKKNSKIYSIHTIQNAIKHIMDQYIYEESEYCINISSEQRYKLITSYKKLENSNINKIEQDIEAEPILMEERGDDKKIIIQYISMFDGAMDTIISLIKMDSLQRFYETKQYQAMTQNKCVNK